MWRGQEARWYLRLPGRTRSSSPRCRRGGRGWPAPSTRARCGRAGGPPRLPSCWTSRSRRRRAAARRRPGGGGSSSRARMPLKSLISEAIMSRCEQSFSSALRRGLWAGMARRPGSRPGSASSWLAAWRPALRVWWSGVSPPRPWLAEAALGFALLSRRDASGRLLRREFPDHANVAIIIIETRRTLAVMSSHAFDCSQECQTLNPIVCIQINLAWFKRRCAFNGYVHSFRVSAGKVKFSILGNFVETTAYQKRPISVSS